MKAIITTHPPLKSQQPFVMIELLPSPPTHVAALLWEALSVGEGGAREGGYELDMLVREVQATQSEGGEVQLSGTRASAPHDPLRVFVGPRYSTETHAQVLSFVLQRLTLHGIAWELAK